MPTYDKAKRKVISAKYYQKVKKQRADKHLMDSYGVTRIVYNQIHEDQEGCCAICKTHVSDLPRPLVVDHVHGMEGNPFGVRGLLCYGCNTGLGALGDDIEGLEVALQYLKDYANKN